MGVAAAGKGAFVQAALAIGLASYLKIYPVAIGLLLTVMAPRKFGAIFALSLALLGLSPFLFQHWPYVESQYALWTFYRLHEDRLQFSAAHAPLDLWFLLVRAGGLPISATAYRGLQVLTGALAALYVVAGRRKSWPRERLLAGIFALGCIWMTLLGPATEGLTYILVAPAVVLAFVQSFVRLRGRGETLAVTAATLLLLLAVAKNSLFPRLNHSIWIHAVQPIGAICFLVFCCLWLFRDDAWEAGAKPEHADPA
jgi:hypothetical protein